MRTMPGFVRCIRSRTHGRVSSSRRRTPALRMRMSLWTAVMLGGLTASAAAEELPLSRVGLSTSGLAQFTHSGSITGGSTVDLSVRLQQVDDSLKRLTVIYKEAA